MTTPDDRHRLSDEEKRDLLDAAPYSCIPNVGDMQDTYEIVERILAARASADPATATVQLEDLRTVLQSVDWNGDERGLTGPVDRMSEVVALATMRQADPAPERCLRCGLPLTAHGSTCPDKYDAALVGETREQTDDWPALTESRPRHEYL